MTIKKQKELLERIIEGAPSMIIGIDLHGNIMIFNRIAEGLTGYFKEEAIGKSFFSLLVPEGEREEINAIFDEIIEGGEIYNFERHIITKDGEERLIFWSGGAMNDSENMIIGNICIGNDITEKEVIQAMEELRELDQEDSEMYKITPNQISPAIDSNWPYDEGTTSDVDWENAFNSIADSIVIIGKDDRILRANTAFARKLNAEPQELMGKKCCEVFHDTNSPIHGCICKKISNEGEAFSEEVYDENSGMTTLISCSPYYNAKGELMGSLLMAKDLTKKNSIEEEPVEAKEMDIGSLISAMEHEMNNPLGGVLSCAEAIMEEEDPLKVRLYSKEITDAATRITKILNSLARYSQTPLSHAMEPIDLNDIINLSVKMMKNSANFDNVDIVTELKPIPKIEGNPKEIMEVFINLISNSLETMEGNGKIYILTDTLNGNVQTVFKDDGAGIPEEQISKIFDPFFITESGTGLRMYAISRILKKHKAPISVESELGKGTAFTINFPYVEMGKDNA